MRIVCPQTAVALLLGAAPALAATVHTGTDEQARLPFWEAKTRGASVRLVQRLPDQTRGYFMARGFGVKEAELIAQSCVFQTVFSNLTGKQNGSDLAYDLDQWRIVQKQHQQKPRTREDWESVWRKRGVAQPLWLAFKWSLLPTRQTYHPGDYNWGMSIFGLEPGSRFDLHLSWQQLGQRQEIVIPDMQCAPDIHPDPAQQQVP